MVSRNARGCSQETMGSWEEHNSLLGPLSVVLEQCSNILGLYSGTVRDLPEVYRMFGEMICGTHMVHMGSPEREEACSFCFLALRLVSRVDYSFS